MQNENVIGRCGVIQMNDEANRTGDGFRKFIWEQIVSPDDNFGPNDNVGVVIPENLPSIGEFRINDQESYGFVCFPIDQSKENANIELIPQWSLNEFSGNYDAQQRRNEAEQDKSEDVTEPLPARFPGPISFTMMVHKSRSIREIESIIRNKGLNAMIMSIKINGTDMRAIWNRSEDELEKTIQQFNISNNHHQLYMYLVPEIRFEIRRPNTQPFKVSFEIDNRPNKGEIRKYFADKLETSGEKYIFSRIMGKVESRKEKVYAIKCDGGQLQFCNEAGTLFESEHIKGIRHEILKHDDKDDFVFTKQPGMFACLPVSDSGSEIPDDGEPEAVEGDFFEYRHVGRNGKIFAVLRSNKKLYLKYDMELLKSLQHQNILRYYGTTKTPGNNFDYYLERMRSSTTLEDKWWGKYRNSEANKEEACRITSQILSAVDYLHSVFIIHGKISTKMVLIGEQEEVKLMMFEQTSKDRKRNDTKGPHTEKSDTTGISDRLIVESNSNTYRSPEVVLSKEPAPRQAIGIPCDVWSVGAIFQALYTGKLPWEEKDDYAIYQEMTKINRPDQNIEVSNPEAKEIFDAVYVYDVGERISASDLRDRVLILRSRHV